jgi:predicted esterase
LYSQNVSFVLRHRIGWTSSHHESKVTAGVVATEIHGRYLAIPPATPGPAPILVGFHGYAEAAETQIERLRAIPESSRWLTVSIQGLHRFYLPRTDRVVASWMTRQDRELAIADNIAYVAACVDAAAAAWPTVPKIVFAGFSQGVAMAFRAAVNSARPVAGVIAVAGDVPPELEPHTLQRVSAALIARGTNDNLYTKEQFAADERRLRQCCTRVRVLEFDKGHEWSGDVTEAASRFLHEFHP